MYATPVSIHFRLCATFFRLPRLFRGALQLVDERIVWPIALKQSAADAEEPKSAAQTVDWPRHAVECANVGGCRACYSSVR